MIIEVFSNLILGIMQTLIELIPVSGSFPSAFFDSVIFIKGLIYQFDFILPVSAIEDCILLATAFISFRIFWDLIFWILRKIPFVNVR